MHKPNDLKGLSARLAWAGGAVVLAMLLASCSSTEVIQSPRTTHVALTGEAKTPKIIWTSRKLERPFDYLGTVKARAWGYDSALQQLVEGAKELRADAIIDVHYEKVGFLNALQAFAVKFKE